MAALLTIALRSTPHQKHIAPLVESDYAYQLIAVDRLFEGHGLTSLQPVAPHQPWNWQYDWGYLTQWPVGYPLLVAGVRAVSGGTSLEAAQRLGAAACAFALVGWFLLALQIVPRGVTRHLLAAVTAGVAVPASTLINPSTDGLVVAALPWLLLAAAGTIAPDPSDAGPRSLWHRYLLLGLFAGTLCWIRYAAIFVPAAVGIYLAVVAATTKRATRRDVLAYAIGAATPVLALLATNAWLSPAASPQAQLNLGHTISFDFSLGLIALAWSKFTALGFYDHRPAMAIALRLWPAALAVGLLLVPRGRDFARTFLARPAVGLSATLVIALLGMLVVATAMFGGKFDYAGLDRYYLPAKPLYCLLFVAPLILMTRRVVRAGLCLALGACLLWTIQVDWSRPLQRWTAADRPTAPSGAWNRAFEPDANALYAWLRDRNDPSLIVVSNYHEYVALETGLATLPIPPDRVTLDQWVERIAASRGITEPRVLFVLDPDNRWRSYWIPETQKVERAFALIPYHLEADTAAHPRLFGYQCDSPATARTETPSPPLDQ